ncbi:putative receptor-like protein kinase [Hibiscus syriacus]|uniref:Receptor-like protein kinase n=1 Tax=Hibiscus syriacus TaxID=106335 RepID=A0A6A2Z8A4_HIBSY|nr:putative receptor-like protein kinase [Hibiscus syriacus]
MGKENRTKGSVAVIEYRLLETATNGFQESNVLGEGGCGRVYKASFDEKFLAAVKKLVDVGVDAEREFENEVDWLVKIRHQNIVSLLGYCIHGETRLLVYEMMQNGSLESQLHGPSQGSALSWHLRMKIAIDVARALEYLHENCNPPVVHRDIKSSNILLDSNFNAKLSDFGLAVTTESQNKNVELSGTLGYVAPEYLLEKDGDVAVHVSCLSKLTDKSDVYAFGVVLLELLIGKKPLEKMSPTRCQSRLMVLIQVMPQLTDRLKLPNIVDPVIKDTMDLKHLYQVAAIAVLCIQTEPSYRPLITDVLHSLIPLVPVELGAFPHSFLNERFLRGSDAISLCREIHTFGFLIVHPGGHVELHDRPILAADIIYRNPRCVVAHPHVFQQPWAIVAPETELPLGQKFYVVPISTIRKLQRLSNKYSSTPTISESQQNGELKAADKDDSISICWFFTNKNNKTPYSRMNHSSEGEDSSADKGISKDMEKDGWRFDDKSCFACMKTGVKSSNDHHKSDDVDDSSE